MAGKHVGAYPYYWFTHQTYWSALRYVGRHRGVYDPCIGTVLGLRHIGEMRVKIVPDLHPFDLAKIEALRTGWNNMVTIRAPHHHDSMIDTLPNAPWVVWRE